MSGENYRLSATLAAGPDAADGLCARGDAMQASGQLEAAAALYREALGLRPDFARAAHHLGNALERLGSFDAAIETYRAAQVAAPDRAVVPFSIGNVLQRLDRPAAALAEYRAALALRPDWPEAIAQAVHLRQQLCDWRDYADDCAALREAARSGPRNLLFLLRTVSPTAGELAECTANAAAALAPLRATAPQRRAVSGRRLRIGYLSSDFRQHPVGRMLAGVIEAHDRSRFEVIACSTGRDDGSAERMRLVNAADRFVELEHVPDERAAAELRALEIDILVDLNGLTAGQRPGILARRPAPVQAGWLGYLGTLGGPELDFVIADPFTVPLAQQPFYAERIVHLPGSYLPVVAFADSATPSRASLGLPQNGFVFCCFNNSYKITPPMFDVWMRLLRDFPGSVLWLFAHADARGNLMREAVARGVGTPRLVFAERVGIDAFLARLPAADLFLDTLPCSACTTGRDALGAGLPLLSCAGDIFAGRHAGSLLLQLGLPELLTFSLAEYEARARLIAGDPDLLGDLRSRLRVSLASGGADSRAFTAGLERLYTRMQTEET